MNDVLRSAATEESENSTIPPACVMLDQALALHGKGQLDEADKLYRQILEADPRNADSLHLLGMIAFQSGDCDRAVTLIGQAIAIYPNAASYHSNLGNILQQQGYARDAAACYLQAIRIKPGLAEAHVNLANVFLAAKEFDSAVTWYQHALAIDPGIAEAHKNLGNAFLMQQKLDLAAESYRRALLLKPGYVEAMTDLGTVMRASGDLDAALTHLRAVLQLEPDHPNAAFREALILLLQGNFAAGWSCYEQRWKSTDHATPMRDYPQPFWQAEHVRHGRLLLWPEQGVGDEIMFAGLIPEVLRTGNQCVVECDIRLHPLFERSFSGIEVITDRSAALDPQRDIVVQSPMGSLPRLFRESRAAFASGSPAYLKPDPAKTAECRSRYGDCRLRLGIAWRSDNEKTGRLRSIDLQTLRPLFDQPNSRWISLQYGSFDDLEAAVSDAQAPIFVDSSIDQLVSIDNFAAQIAALDLVITIDNTTAHLAGALGLPVWVLLPFAPDWRWLAAGDTSPWYPSMRLFRQPRPADWNSVVQQVAKALTNFLADSPVAV